MAKEFVLISINTNIETSNAEFGMEFLNFLSSFDERLCPEVYSCNPSKITTPFNGAEEAMKSWLATVTVGLQSGDVTSPTDFYWKRKRAVKSSGSIAHSAYIGKKRIRRWGAISIEFAVNKKLTGSLFLKSYVC